MAYIKWDAVFSFFVADESATLADAARHFKINIDYVRQVAAREKWSAKKLQVKQSALKLIEGKAVTHIAKRNEAMIKMGRELQDLGMEAIKERQIKPKNFEDARRAIETGIRIERQSLNMDKPADPAVNILNAVNQRILISWGDNEPVGEFIQSDGKLECIKSFDPF